LKLLIVGARGQLGSALERASRKKGWAPAAVDLPQVDIADPENILAALKASSPDLVVNAAAYTAVDRAEDEPEAAFSANRDGPRNLARACARSGIVLIHVSTDYVFDGTAGRPYTEDDPVSPLGVYGKSKAAGEDAVRSELPAHFIVRTSWLYAARGHNFVRTMIRVGKTEKVVRVVADQFGCPTSAQDLAAVLLLLAEQAVTLGSKAPWGTYHFCNRGATSWHGFAETIFAKARGRIPLRVERVAPISTAEYPAAAPRPAYSTLSCDRIRRRFGVAPRPWEDALSEVLEEIIAEETAGRGIVR
jgi:dTDP-4-dehydrorhamnose reductase